MGSKITYKKIVIECSSCKRHKEVKTEIVKTELQSILLRCLSPERSEILDSREVFILESYFGLKNERYPTFAEIGKITRISKGRVLEILNNSITKLSKRFNLLDKVFLYQHLGDDLKGSIDFK
jgi:DNA-directed RNA polymerase sigma subunit (sigma70/sigma32)